MKMSNLKIFVSSPMKRLEAERKEAKKSLEMLGFDYFISEYSSSSPISSFEKCITNVRESEVFILLLGDRYGDIPPNQDFSITELEFLEARRLNMPIFVFRFDRSTVEPKQIDFISRVEHLSKGYFRGRRLYSPSELKQRIIHDLSAYLSAVFKQNVVGETAKCPLCKGSGIILVKNRAIVCSMCGVNYISSKMSLPKQRSRTFIIDYNRITDSIFKGEKWISCSQNQDGGWGASIGMKSDAANTALAMRALNLIPTFSEHVKRGANWLLENQLANGSWGLYMNSKESVFCTSVSVYSLQKIGNEQYSLQIRNGQKWIEDSQNPDGSWGRTRGESGSVHETFLALRVFDINRFSNKSFRIGIDWLLKKQKGKGTWCSIGENDPDPHLTSEIIGFLYIISMTNFYEVINAGINWLKNHQNKDGTWTLGNGTFNNTATQFYNLLVCEQNLLDSFMRRALKWILKSQLDDGSWVGYIPSKQGNINSSSMAVRALSLALEKRRNTKI
jgi:prenyltransferase beta subunit